MGQGLAERERRVLDTGSKTTMQAKSHALP